MVNQIWFVTFFRVEIFGQQLLTYMLKMWTCVKIRGKIRFFWKENKWVFFFHNSAVI